MRVFAGRSLTAALVAAAVALAACPGGGAPANRRPNVLIFMIDTLRADRLGSYGNPRDTSPNLDAFARQGLLFEGAFAPSPHTAPSHASLFTSTYPSVHAIWNVVPVGGEKLHPVLSDRSRTLAEVLRDAGFATAAIADGGWVVASRGLDQGFETFESETKGVEDRVDRALEWLGERDASRAFFLFLHTYEVHVPYLPPEEYVALFDDDYRGPVRHALESAREYVRRHEVSNPLDVHKQFFAPLQEDLDADGRAFLLALYDAELRVVDDHFGRLLAHLRDTGLEDDTLVIVTSDHGEEFGEHGHFQHRQVYRETVHIPLLVRGPGTPVGARRGALVDLVDLMPSLLAYLAIEPPEALQGRVIDFRSAEQRLPPRPLVSQVRQPRRQLAVRTPEYTAIFSGVELEEAVVFEAAGGEEREAGETAGSARILDEARAVAARHVSEGEALRRQLGLEPEMKPGGSLAPDLVDQLRRLGYLE